MCNAACELAYPADLGKKPSLADTEKIPAFGILYEHSDYLSLNSICATLFVLYIRKAAPIPNISFLDPLEFNYKMSFETASTLRNSWIMR